MQKSPQSLRRSRLRPPQFRGEAPGVAAWRPRGLRRVASRPTLRCAQRSLEWGVSRDRCAVRDLAAYREKPDVETKNLFAAAASDLLTGMAAEIEQGMEFQFTNPVPRHHD